MTFVSVPPERFLYDVYRTWIRLFKDDPAFANVYVTFTQPDISKEKKFPCVILRRASSHDLTLTRNSGLHATTHDETANEVGQLYGYSLLTQLQFDIWAESESQLFELSAKVRAKLFNPFSTAPTNFRHRVTVNKLKVRDWPVVSGPPVDTDLFICWKYHRDVGEQKIPMTPGDDIHQAAVRVNFWVDYLTEERVPKILKLDSDVIEVNGQAY